MVGNRSHITGFACTRGNIKEKPKKCYMCGKPATILCDAPKSDNLFGLSCDIPMCKDHAHRIGPDNDVCGYHYNEMSIRQAKKNRYKLEQWGWGREKSYVCPVCENVEHGENAKFCKICGTKIQEVNDK
jgi:hypothetical protein